MPTVSHRRGFRVLTVVLSLGLAIATSAALGQARKPPAATAPAKTPATRPAGATAKPAPKPAGVAAKPAPAKPAVAKEYKKLPADEAQRRKKSDISRVLRAGRFESGEQAAFDTYYKTYFFPTWTHPDNFALVTIERGGRSEVKMREDVRRDLTNDFRTAKTGPVYTHLSALSLETLAELAKGDYHPVSRFNAMLMIGDLNVSEPARPTDPPVPLPEALPVLLEAVKAPEQIDVVRVAALRGLVRHSSLGIADPQFRDATLIPAMIEVATTRVSPGRTTDGQIWMRMLAIEVLGNLRSIGPRGEVVQALMAVVGEPDGPLLVRSMAAKALGQLVYQPDAVAMNPLPMATSLAELLVQACSRASQTGDGQVPSIRRRELKEQVICVRIALEGAGDNRKGILGLATTDAPRATITNLLEQIQKITDMLDNKDLEDATLIEQLLPIVTTLRPAPATPAAPAAPTAPVNPAAADEPGSFSTN